MLKTKLRGLSEFNNNKPLFNAIHAEKLPLTAQTLDEIARLASLAPMTLLPLTLGTLFQVRCIRHNLQNNKDKKIQTSKTKITICTVS